MNIVKDIRVIRQNILLQLFIVICIPIVNWLFGKEQIGLSILICLYTVVLIRIKDTQRSLEFFMLCVLIIFVL